MPHCLPPQLARWPSPLPRGPARHGTVSCATEGAVSWCHLCPWELPSLSPKSHQGRPRCRSCSPPAVEQGYHPCDTFPQCQRGLLTHSSCTAPQGARGHPAHTVPIGASTTLHPTRHPPEPARQHPRPGTGREMAGRDTAAQEGPWGTGPGGQDSGQVEVSPSALFYQP